MRNEKVFGVVLVLLNYMAITVIDFPILVKVVILLLNILLIIGFLYIKELLMEVAFLGIYLLSLIFAAYRYEFTPLALLATTYLLIVRDALHIIAKGRLSGVRYVITWHLPVYMASMILSILGIYAQTLLPKIPSTLLMLALLLVLYSVVRFISFSSESTPR